VLPLLAVSVVEKVAFNTSHVASSLLKYRVMGHLARAFVFDKQGGVIHLTPGTFLATPGLWAGLAFAAAFLAAAARLRRYRGPI
jgi:ABC-2 type transport system permease protein